MTDQSSPDLIEFERIIEEMEWEEMVSMLTEVIEAELRKAPPAELPAPQLSLGGSQNLPNSSSFHPLAPDSMHGQEASAPYITLYPIYVVLPPSLAKQVHQAPAAAAPAAPAAPLSSCSSPRSQEEYIKKPPNAFMLFIKEQRAKVKAELNINNCSALNKVLGERWTSLSLEEKKKYVEQAQQEQKLFEQKHPGWSTAQNYGKRKRKRTASTAAATAVATAAGVEESGPEAFHQAKRPCIRPKDLGSAPPPPASTT